VCALALTDRRAMQGALLAGLLILAAWKVRKLLSSP
jgi:hypothetical protein